MVAAAWQVLLMISHRICGCLQYIFVEVFFHSFWSGFDILFHLHDARVEFSSNTQHLFTFRRFKLRYGCWICLFFSRWNEYVSCERGTRAVAATGRVWAICIFASTSFNAWRWHMETPTMDARRKFVLLSVDEGIYKMLFSFSFVSSHILVRINWNLFYIFFACALRAGVWHLAFSLEKSHSVMRASVDVDGVWCAAWRSMPDVCTSGSSPKNLKTLEVLSSTGDGIFDTNQRQRQRYTWTRAFVARYS